jgi:hypothetical protein
MALAGGRWRVSWQECEGQDYQCSEPCDMGVCQLEEWLEGVVLETGMHGRRRHGGELWR